MMRFSANLSMLFAELPLAERFAAAARAGFQTVEIQFPYELETDQLKALLSAHDLRLDLINTPEGPPAAGGRGLAAMEGYEAAFRAGLDIARDYMLRLGCPKLHVMSGLADLAAPGVRARLLYNLQYAADLMADIGADIVIEPLNRQDAPGYALNDFDAATALLEALQRPNAKLLFDVYHRQMLHGNVTGGLMTLAPKIGHVQIAGVPGRHEPDESELNLAHVLRTLETIGYQGHVGCEYHPRGDTLAGLTWLKEIS